MTATKLTTLADFDKLPEGGRWYELFHGELRKMSPANSRHGDIALQIGSLLRNFARRNKLGSVVVEGGFILTHNPDTIVGPDVAFIAQSRIPPTGLPESFFDGPPDLAVEIVSPNDSHYDVMDKVNLYLRHGAPLVWVVSPKSQTIALHRPASSTTLQSSDTITGEDVLPGFACRVSEFFEA